MLQEHTNFQYQDKYYLKINNLRNIDSLTIEQGTFYICISGISHLDKFIGGGVKRKFWSFSCFHREIEFPLDIKYAQIERTVDVFLADFKMLKHIKVNKMLKKMD